MDRRADVIVVGGGPAGASLAFHLATRGVPVRVLDRARFPRSKACAECLSPQASRILDRMGVLSTLEPRAAQMRGIDLRSPDGSRAFGDYRAEHGFRGFRDYGLSIRRETLDATLIDAARKAGAIVDERAHVTDVLQDSAGTVNGVAVATASGEQREIPARIIVGADGLRSLVARKMGVARSWPWPKRLAIVAHFRGVTEVRDRIELVVERDGFAGIADVGGGVTTVAAVFPRRRAHEFAGNAERFLLGWLQSKPHLSRRFRQVELDGDVRVTGPFASHARRAWAPGAFLVGDAADFFDPFTGEGIYAALRGGELLSEHVIATLSELGTRESGVAYDAARRKEFGGKWIVEAAVGIGVANPMIMNFATRALRANKPLADLIAGITGDFVPAGALLRLA